MFLLFSTAGAGGTLLEEQERGTLERLLACRVTMSQVLAAHWIFLTLMGAVQVACMFLWGSIVFDVALFHVPTLVGFVIMTVATAGAAAAFGLVFATACRSRAQLSGISTIVILIISALGGSMIPTFAAPAVFDLTKRFTFNGWALEGFLEVFWYAEPDAGVIGVLAGIAPAVGVLAAIGLAFLVTARLLARRWEVIG